MTDAAAVLVDTSIWADHFRAGDPDLAALLADGRARLHSFVVGELAMGNLRERDRTIDLLQAVPAIPAVDRAAWLAFVADEGLGGCGLGFVDAHLLAATVAADARLWTRDRRLARLAADLGCDWTG